MQKIGIDRERRFAALVLGDGNLVLLGEFDQLRAARQAPFAPRRDDADIGVQRVIRQLKADLIIALPVAPCATASAPVFSAISICFLAISGRALDVPRR
jgi:hypothetical protein